MTIILLVRWTRLVRVLIAVGKFLLRRMLVLHKGTLVTEGNVPILTSVGVTPGRACVITLPNEFPCRSFSNAIIRNPLDTTIFAAAH